MNRLICSDTPATADQWSGNTPKKFEAACKAGLALAKSLGKDWNARVWENLGWHYEARSADDRIHVFPYLSHDDVEGYGVTVGEPGHIGAPSWGWGRGKTPEKAMASAIKNAKSYLREIAAIVEGL